MSNQLEFRPWPKTPRLNRDITITEKIDGTNAAVIIQPVTADMEISVDEVYVGEDAYVVGAQSRNRLITPEQDNFGFAAWVRENKEELVGLLGPGYHYGEWWGSGIGRGYGLKKGERVFSLFNVHRYEHLNDEEGLTDLRLVPVLYRGPFDQYYINAALGYLRTQGSQAAPGFDRPEGIIVFHSASQQVFKATVEKDEAPKSAAGVAA